METKEDVRKEQAEEAMNQRKELPLDDDIKLVSPNKDVFKKINEEAENSGVGYASTWHDTDSDDSMDNFEVDEFYASSAESDRKFNETFGIGTEKPTSKRESKESAKENEDTSANIDSDAYEYTDRSQRKEIIGMYKYAKSSLRIKTIFSLIFTFLLFLFENIKMFSSSPSGFFDITIHPYIHTGISYLLLILTAAFSYEQLYHGAKSLKNKEYIPEAVAVVAFGTALINGVIQLLVTAFGKTPTLYNFPVAFILSMSVLYSLLNVKREKYGFSVVSSKDNKFILEMVEEKNAEAEFDTFTTTANGDFNGEIARVGKTGFVKNYFRNTNAPVVLRNFLSVYFGFTLIVPLVLAIISLFTKTDIAFAFASLNMGLLLIIPSGVFFTYSVPFLIGNKRLFEDEVSIIGEEAIAEYSKVDVVAVNDTTAFPAKDIKLSKIKVFNGYGIEKALHYAYTGFSCVGGPLASVFEAAINDTIPKSKKVKFVCAGRGYFCVRVDSDKIIFADKFGMTAQGIEIGAESEKIDNLSVLYVASNGVLCAKIYIKYTLDDEFLKIASLLNKNGITIGIRTFDPSINNEMLARLADFKRKDVRVIKLSSIEDAPKASAKSDAQIVSKGLSRSLLKALPVCKKIETTRKVNNVVKALMSIAGVVYLAFSVFGSAPLLLSGAIVGFYIATLSIITLITYAIIPRLK